jgi:ribonuclease P protein component
MADALASMRATLPASARLHRPSEYAQALKGKRLARGALFVVSTPRLAPESTPELTTARLGLIIAKRFARRAVTRNTVKRVIREAFRNRRLQLPARDFVFRLQTRLEPQSLTQLKQQVRLEVEQLLEQVAR